MKKKVLSLLLLVSSLSGFGQCPSGNIGLFSQADVDNFATNYPGCTQVNNGLFLSGSGITNLNGLSQVEGVGTSSGGFGGPLLIGCPNLTSLTGLDNLIYIGGGLGISGTQITDLSGLENLETLRGSINLDENDMLIDFNGFDSLTTVDGGLQVTNCDAIQNFSGLGNIGTTDSGSYDITIVNNENLQDFTGLEGWAYVRNFNVVDNLNLTSISGAGNTELLNSTGVVITGNSNLPMCAIMLVCDSFNDPGSFQNIANNASGCSSPQEVEAECDLSVNDLELASKIDLYPVPSDNFIMISICEGILLENIIIYSNLGEQILRSSEKIIDISSLSEGIYFVLVDTDKGSIIKKIVKE